MEGSPQGVGSSVALPTLCSGTVRASFRGLKATQLVALCDSRPRELIRMGTFRWVDAWVVKQGRNVPNLAQDMLRLKSLSS